MTLCLIGKKGRLRGSPASLIPTRLRTKPASQTRRCESLRKIQGLFLWAQRFSIRPILRTSGRGTSLDS